MAQEWPLDPRDFSAYYSFAPAALAIRECVRLRAVRELDLAEPLLDVGCGDGLFARLAYPDKQAWGIDVNPSEVQRAQRTASYMTLICGNIVGVHLPKSFFGSAIANCSLEHVPDIQGALTNIHHALKPDGQLVLIVPTPDWTQHLVVPEALRSIGLLGLAQAYGDGLDKVFSHVHLYDEDGWRLRLERAGYEVEEVRPIAMRATSWAFDMMLYPSLVAWVTRRLTGRWIAMPSLRPMTVDFARAVVNAIGKLAPSGDAPAEYLILARKRGQ
ncbi:MAG TPA: methyltransferase domain-containing protein [Labilithrix sp.]|nr:methyltransferase domain-containing protein [Labilithrix sp.]